MILRGSSPSATEVTGGVEVTGVAVTGVEVTG
jgi:hypothetical protein